MHCRVVKELDDVVAKPLSMSERLWESSEVLGDWKKGKMSTSPCLKRKDDPENYQPVSLSSGPGKNMEEILLEARLEHMKDKGM